MAQSLPPGDNWPRVIYETGSNRSTQTWLGDVVLPLEPQEAVRLICQVCDDVIERHNGPVDRHRMHIAPHTISIMLDTEGQPHAYLLDDPGAGAFVRSSVSSGGMFIESVAGTWPPPVSSATTDERTHINQIGELLYQLVTGQRPIRGAERPRADALAPNVPRALADVIERAMAHDPQARFGSVVELRAALLDALPRPVPTTGGTGTSDDGWIVVMGFIVVAVVGFLVWLGSQGGTTTNLTGGVPPVLPTAPPVLPTAPPATATPDAVATLTAAEGQFKPLVEAQAGELPATAAGPSPVLVAGPLADFSIVAVFVNPPTPGWDYGFAFRHNAMEHYRLSIASDGQWRLVFRTEDPAVPGYAVERPVAQGTATGLLLEPGAANEVRLLVSGPYGRLSINNNAGAPFDLRLKVAAGDVYVAAGMNSAANGAVVPYRDVNVRGPE